MIFRNESACDTLSLHYTVANPVEFGIITKEPSLPLYNKDNEKEQFARTENYLAALNKFDSSLLSDDDSYTYKLLKKKFIQELKGNQYFYYNEVLSPSCGIQTQYPILMTEYAFRSKKDIDDYLDLLSDTPSYFQSLIKFEKEKSKRGYFMADYSLNKTILQCNTIITEKDLSSSTHFLQTTFEERINTAIDKGLISKDEGLSYRKKNDIILKDKVYPAYIDLGNSLLALSGTGKNKDGLAHYPNGKDYYSWLFIQNVGSYTDLDTVYHKLAQDYYNNFQSLSAQVNTFQETCDLTTKDIYYFPIAKPEEMIKNLSSAINSDFPSIASIASHSHTNVSVKKVSNSLEDYTAPAYYFTPPIDNVSENIIYINNKNAVSGISLYSTLAHEGYPGHLYQTVYYQLYQNSKNQSPIRAILNYGGYVEGWALYTELYSFEYASKFLSESTDKESYDTLYSIYADERRTQLSLLSLLDIAIHYYGITFDRVKEILNSYGVVDEAQARSIYEYIVEEPTVYPKYYWGYLEIMKLKDSAKKKWGNTYSDYRFHQFFLQAGPSDYETLNNKLINTISK